VAIGQVNILVPLFLGWHSLVRHSIVGKKEPLLQPQYSVLGEISRPTDEFEMNRQLPLRELERRHRLQVGSATVSHSPSRWIIKLTINVKMRCLPSLTTLITESKIVRLVEYHAGIL